MCSQSYPTLCDPVNCSLPGSSVHWILQARTLEWVAISFSKRNYRKKDSEVVQSCPTLCDPMDCSLPGSSIHGIFQARVLEWGAISFSLNGLITCIYTLRPLLGCPLLRVAKMACFFFYLPVHLSLKREILSKDPGIWAVELS